MENNLTTQDVYQQITNRVIAAIEAGAPHFEMPWHSKTGRSRPINVHTGKPYRGINTLALWIAQLQYGFNTSTWGTYRQWKACNAQVRKGERAAVVVFYKDMERPVKNPATGETEQERYFVANASWVFNADQVDGWNPPESYPREDGYF